MRIDILTLFPSMFSPLGESIIGKAREKGILDVSVTDIRSFAKDKHRTADDTPYGGGPGMVMKPDLIFEALEHIKSKHPTSNIKHQNRLQNPNPKPKIILLSPSGRRFDQEKAWELSKFYHLVFICGHYEGVDERVRELADEEISIGDYVLTGGELAAMAVIDAVTRLIPGVLGDESSAADESFSQGLLEYPQYTKPADHSGKKVPEVLTGGNHKNIAAWRRRQAVINTFFKRPDLLAAADIASDDSRTLETLFTGE